MTKNPLVIFVQRVRRCQGCLVAGVVSRNVPKGEQTVNWAGESLNYIPFQIRNQSQHLRWSNEQPSGNNAADQRAQGVGIGEVDDGFRMEGSRGRSLRRRRVGLTEAAFLLLAIKAIMRCHTIRVPTLKYDKTIQMLGIRFSSSLSSPPTICIATVALWSRFFTLESWDKFVSDSRKSLENQVHGAS